MPATRIVLLFIVISGITAWPTETGAQSLDSFTGAFNYFLSLQQSMVFEIGKYMLAIKDGASLVALWSGIGFAFLYGAIAALGPGHGTMMMTAYFLGRETRLSRGLLMGAQIALCHVISAAVLVWLMDLSFSQFILGTPFEVIGVRIVSYILIGLVGALLLMRLIQRRRHAPDEEFHPEASLRQQSLLALMAGIVPSTGGVLIMLFAISNGILETGLWLAAALAAGMAVTMAIIGMVGILLRRIIMIVAESQKKGVPVIMPILDMLSPALLILVGIGFLINTLMDEFF